MTDAPAPPCLEITSVCQGKPYVLGIQKQIGLQIRNKEHSGFLLQSLFLGDVTTSQAEKSDVCSLFHCFSLSFQDSPNALQDFNVIYSKKICCFMFLYMQHKIWSWIWRQAFLEIYLVSVIWLFHVKFLNIFFFLSVRSFGEGNGSPLQYSCLENPRERGAWWATVQEVAESHTSE